MVDLINVADLPISDVVEGEDYVLIIQDGIAKIANAQDLPFIIGPRGSKGDTGTSISIKGRLTDESELPNIGASGDAYMIGGNLWVWSDDTNEFIDVGSIKGDKGDQGIQGERGFTGPAFKLIGYGTTLPSTTGRSPGDAYRLNDDLYIWDVDTSAWVYSGRFKGDKGDQGRPLIIKGILPNQAALPTNAVEGDAYLIGDHLWMYTNAWIDLGVMYGRGDMFESIYDPTGVHGNAFAMDKMVEGTNTKIMTAAERTKLTGVETGATKNQTDAYLLARANHTGTIPTSVVVGLDTHIAATQLKAEKGANNGYAGLDGTGRVPLAQTNASVIGAVNRQGTWNASTNTPTIPAASTANKGHYYVVDTVGNSNISGITTWDIGDWVVSNGSTWERVQTIQKVSSVNGKAGDVVIVAGDITSGTFNDARLPTSQAGKNFTSGISVRDSVTLNSPSGNTSVSYQTASTTRYINYYDAATSTVNWQLLNASGANVRAMTFAEGTGTLTVPGAVVSSGQLYAGGTGGALYNTDGNIAGSAWGTSLNAKAYIDAKVAGVDTSSKVSKTGDRMSGELWVEYANPIIKHHYPGVRIWYTQVISNGTYRWVDESAGAERFRIQTDGIVGGANWFIPTDGNLYGSAFGGYLTSWVEGRANAQGLAWANDRVQNLQYRFVSRNRFVNNSGSSIDMEAPAGAVLTGGFMAGDALQRPFYRSAQIFDPVLGWRQFTYQ